MFTLILFLTQGKGKEKRTFKKFQYRGIDLENLLDLSNEQLIDLVHARARRRFSHRGLKRKPMALLKKLRAAVSISWREKNKQWPYLNIYRVTTEKSRGCQREACHS